MVLLLYVDDILLIGSDESLTNNLLEVINRRFAMKDMGPPRYFLGIKIEAHHEFLFLHQRAYVEDILHQAALSKSNLMPTPLP